MRALFDSLPPPTARIADAEVEGGLVDIGEAEAAVLHEEMRGAAPESFLADQPRTVGDGVEERAREHAVIGLAHQLPPLARRAADHAADDSRRIDCRA